VHDACGTDVTKLVYIGGYGHSGSTLVEYLMTASPQVIACGEVASSLREHLAKKRCTCGQLTEDCPIWGPFAETSGRLEGWKHQDLTAALLERASGQYGVLVDSSKTAWHSATTPLRLRRRLGPNFLLVHIVRDPRAVSWSVLKKAERRGDARSGGALRCAFTTLGWWTANLTCELFGRMYPDQYVRLGYEELVRSPREVVSSLFKTLLPEGDYRFDRLGLMGNRHQLYGNRMRSRRLSLEKIKEDQAWRTEMPSPHQRLVEALSWPLRGRYGYS
jgi:hypothetical protein